MATDHVRFESPRHLAEALSLCWRGPFPDVLLEVAPGAYAVPLKGFVEGAGSREAFLHLAKQHGWRVELTSIAKVRAKEVSPRCLIDGEWTYRDPYRLADAPTRNATVAYEAGANVEYVIAARTHEEAQTLLRGLHDHLVPGVTLIPLLLQGAPPFRYFWVLTLERQPLDLHVDLPVSLLRAAPRVWWGPVGSGRWPTYIQWPYSLDVPIAYLEKLDWKAGENGSVFLNAPEGNGDGTGVLVVHASEKPRQEVERFGELYLAKRLLDLAAATEEPKPRFQVELRLGRAEPKDLHEERIATLRREIAARQLLIDALEEEGRRERSVFLDPILFFYESDPSIVPAPLRRLLVEWTDDPSDLGGIYYHRIDARSLPEGFPREPRIVHVVTTIRALGLRDDPSDASLGMRLAEYRQGVQFDLLSDWTEHGLRIFTPRDESLRLYPRLSPGSGAATQLAHALLGKSVSREQRERSLLLLRNDDTHGCLRSCRLDVRGFRPIAEAIPWRCAVQPAPIDPSALPEREAMVWEAFSASVVGAVERTAEAVSQKMIDAKYKEVQQELDACGKSLDGMEARNKHVAGLIARITSDPAASLQTLRDLQKALGELLARIPSDARGTRVTTEAAAYDVARAAHERLLAEAKRLRIDE